MNKLAGYKKKDLNLIQEYIKENGYKLTNPRKKILNSFIKNSHKHLSCKELYDILSNEDIGVSTIYRNIKLFTELDILKEIKLEEKNFYELKMFVRKPFHIHLKCEVCDKIIDVVDKNIVFKLIKINNLIEKELDIEVSDADILLHGRCSRCKTKQAK